MPATLSSEAKPASELRTIFASFAAGVSSMMVAGLVVTLVADGGLSMQNAHASTLEVRAPLIAPLDMIAIQYQLQKVDDAMRAAHLATDPAVARLESLSGS